MKLDKIKLSGFKSFADQTTISINGNLTAVVGPNGCGKSNVIDAVRWAMGESSAKHLRGGHMADVIFNGSATRKPVSTASVELIFDNTEGKAGGAYAKYSAISIRRQVARDGHSQFRLNGSKCRRKDITDLFLGTGLGARSYAIIEQGTISRLVDSKPDELRMHIEEAAGISKYKERRQETETRMHHTQENLERLDDVREEVEKQLSNLKKQAVKAEKFTGLKKQERHYNRELLAIRWNSYYQTSQDFETQLQEIATEHNRLFVLLRETDKAIDAKRIEQKNQQQQVDATQEDYYHVVAEVSRLQQAIKHNESSYAETVIEIDRLKQQAEQSNAIYKQDNQQLEEIKTALVEAEEGWVEAREKLAEKVLKQQQCQQQNARWQKQWEDYLTKNSTYKEQAEIQRVKLSHLNSHSLQLQQRQEKLQTERRALSSTDLQAEIDSLDNSIELIAADREDLQQHLETVYKHIMDQRQQLKQQHEQLHQGRSALHQVNGKISSLELLQQNAMGKDKKNPVPWLEKMKVTHNQRLAEFLEVDSGWDKAVETVLGNYLEAFCVEDMDRIIQDLHTLTEHPVILFETHQSEYSGQSRPYASLLDTINAPWDLSGLLTGIYCAENIVAAKKLSAEIQAHESIITKNGVWMGRNWIKTPGSRDNKSGVLQREKELRDFKQRRHQLNNEIEAIEKQLEVVETSLKEAETHRESLQQRDKTLGSEHGAKNARFSAYSARQQQQQQRLNQISHEIEGIATEATGIAESIEQSEEVKLIAEQTLAKLTTTKENLGQESQQLQSRQQSIDLTVNEAQKTDHALQGQIESLKSAAALSSKQIERFQLQNQQSTERIATLEKKLHSTLMPLDDEKIQLDECVENKKSLEQKLQTERRGQQETDAEITQLTEQHTRTQREMEQQKDSLDKVRFEQQDSHVRQQTMAEQLNELDADPEQILQNLSSGAEEQEWRRKVDGFTKQIERLGSINLTAIEDYQTQSGRINFLNEQHDDLTAALKTLGQAITKIDKESKYRFKETFDKINQGLQEKFPKLFGGGQAYLELTEQNLLEAGVNIIARPPGKRNSSIHLLSGGEKALTAIALVFSIFDLNPAPFCLLDEVDAPLDDANIIRYSALVEEMAESVQLLYVSHNKVTMEIAKQLTGVTMKEAGVSRLVSVDIDEAVEMAES